MKQLLLITFLFVMALIMGCAGGSSRYQPVDTPDTMGSGAGHTDIRMMVDDLVQDMLASSFIERYEKPVTISVLHIENKTSEFLDTDSLIGDKIMMSIIKSGSGVFEFVDRKLLDEAIRESELGASGLVSANEATQLGRAAGVTLLMTGELSSVRKVDRKKDQRYYRISMRLVDTERNTIVWADDKEIVKVASKGAVQW